jgi:hypothetical protein
MMAVLALGTQNCVADITTPFLDVSNWNPATAVAPHCREISLACNTLVVTGAGTTVNDEVVSYT